MSALRSSVLGGCLLCGVATSTSHSTRVVFREETMDKGLLRRKRNDLPKAPSNKMLGSGQEMEDIWEKASRVARSEIETMRLLNSSPDMSMGNPSGDGTPSSPPASTPTGPTESGPTSSPGDCLMGRTKEEYIFDLLVSVSSAESLNDPTTPQGMAFDYLANDDPFLEDPCSSATIEQRYGLTTLYFSTQGADWNDNTGWIGEEQECSWFGVECEDGSDIVTFLLLRK